MMSATPAASGGLSKGCVVSLMWSRMIAAGSRSIQGTSTRTPRQVLLARHMKAGSQLTPDSISTALRPGNLRNTLVDEAEHLGLKRLRRGQIIFVSIGRPAHRARRLAILAAGMDGDRQSVFLGDLVDRPVVPLSQKALALRQHQYGDEPVVTGAALDFLDRQIRRLQGDHDRGPQPRIARQPLGRDPVVDRLAEGGRHIGIVDGLRAVE